MSEFTGKAGTIYVSKSKDVADGDNRWETWFEDFCILGAGNSELEALKDARQQIVDMGQLVAEAISKTVTPDSGASSEETETVSSAGAGD